ncbi:GNAT family N-acetyltransferase [Fulvimarina sp. MAC8]|uniref:GNAT family N-acetyltransferase n=1 Tax=Fulvimarina sp. MAC8 TaxID=3162874 RepID=UPI0032EDA6A9
MPLPQIRPFSSADITAAVALSCAEGWPHRAEDWALIAEISQGFVAMSDGKVVGTAFCTRYGEDAAMLNMIVVDAKMRGRGLGRRIVERIMELAGERQMRLVATEAGLPLYAKLGFVEAERILQHQGEATDVAAPEGIENAAADDWQAIAELDLSAFGGDRSTLLDRIHSVGEALVERGDRGDVVAYAACRPFGRGAVIGPVVAPDAATAKRLIAGHLHSRRGQFVRIDTAASMGIAPWLIGQGLVHVGGGVAMTLGSPPPASPKSGAQLFALAAQALG